MVRSPAGAGAAGAEGACSPDAQPPAAVLRHTYLTREASWIAALLSKLTDRHFEDAFRAADYTAGSTQLIKDEIVLINFMYADCTGIRPGITANLKRVKVKARRTRETLLRLTGKLLRTPRPNRMRYPLAVPNGLRSGIRFRHSSRRLLAPVGILWLSRP